MKRYWIITLALIVAACGGGQKANFSEATDRLEVVSWWVSPSEHPAFEVLNQVPVLLFLRHTALLSGPRMLPTQHHKYQSDR